MTAPDPTPDDIADRIAEDVAAAIPGHYSLEFRRQLVALYVRQALGIEQPPGSISRRALAEALGISGQRVLEIESASLARLHLRHSHTLQDFL